MNFFKSVFADESEPESGTEPLASDSNAEESNRNESGTDSEEEETISNVAISGWDFGGLIKTLATKSESVIDTYKRDLQEFSSGLKAETAVLSEVANRVVKELPKAGVSTFDEFKTTVMKGTNQIISQGKEVLTSLDQEIGSPSAARSGGGSGSGNLSLNYSRFDARMRAIQIDKETYCAEPEDLEDYEKWRSGFVLEEKGEELGKVFEENAAMENLYHKIVPGTVDQETFWYRYFYKVHKMKQAEEVRASFLKKAIDEEEEELSWDVDEEEEEEESDDGEDSKSGDEKDKVAGCSGVDYVEKLEQSGSLKENAAGEKVKTSETDREIVVEEVKRDLGGDGDAGLKVELVVEEPEAADVGKVEEEVKEKLKVDEKEKVGAAVVSEEEKKSEPAPAPAHLENEGKAKSEESVAKGKESATTDEDLSWDEIEDEGSDGDKPVAPRKSQEKTELQKRLSTSIEDEDLSWDIEDDDEPVKA